MALDVSVRSIEDMRNLSNDLKVLSDEMKETFRAAQKEVRSVEESWQDAQYLKFRDEFDIQINRVTIYSLDILLSQFGTSPLFLVQF